MNQEIFAEEALFRKFTNTKSSGYLDDEYELTPEFRQVEDYHFRIEDDQEIIQLQNLQKKSVPMQAGFCVPNTASLQFNDRMNQLLNGLNSAIPMSDNDQKIETQSHGFYKLSEDAYDEKKSLQAAYQHLQLHSLNQRMEALSINSTKIKFTGKPSKGMKWNQQKAEKDLTNKMKKLKISDIQL